jgi:hypothetical protein
MSAKEALPLLEKELNRTCSRIKERQEAILQLHFKQRNEKLSKVFFLCKWVGVKPKLITIEQAKEELENTTYGYDYFNIAGEFVTYNRSTTYANNINKLYLQAKNLANSNASITIDEDHSTFLTWI